MVAADNEQAAIAVRLELEDRRIGRKLAAEIAARLPKLLSEGVAGVASPRRVLTDSFDCASKEVRLTVRQISAEFI